MGKIRRLTLMKKQPKFERFGVFDIENDTQGVIVSIALMWREFVTPTGYTVREEFYTDISAAKEKMEEVTLSNYDNSRKVKQYIWYAHNAEYDTSYLFGNPLENFDMGNFLYTDSGFIYGRRSVGFKETGDNERTMIFLTIADSYKLLPNSVEKIGKTVNIKKLDCDYDKITVENAENLREYNLNDVRIVYEGLCLLEDYFRQQKIRMKPYTIASNAMNLFQSKYMEQYSFECSDEINDFCKRAYAGGRTELYDKNLHKEKLYYYDVNSEYPAAMLKKLPDLSRDVKHYPRMRTRQLKRILADNLDNEFIIAEITGYLPESFAPLGWQKIDKKLKFCYGGIKGVYCEPEIRAMLKAGLELEEVKEVMIFRAAPIFRNYVTDLYDYRKQLKKTDNPQEYIIKLFLNSLYGKTGQQNIERIYGENIDIATLFIPEDKTELDFQWVQMNDKGFGYLEGEQEYSSFAIFPLCAAVTSYARVMLHDYMDYALKFGAKIVYCDTDSLIIDKPVWQDSDKLGAMKLECEIKDFIGIQPKMYQYIDIKTNEKVIKAKGIPLPLVEEFILKNNQVVVTIDDLDLSELKSVKYKKPMKSRQAIRQNMKAGRWYEQKKTVKGLDDKRIWTDNGTSRALLFIDDVDKIELKMKKREEERARKKYQEMIQSDLYDNQLIDSKISYDENYKEFLRNSQYW